MYTGISLPSQQSITAFRCYLPYERLVRDSHALLSIAARYQDVGKIAGRQMKSILIDGKMPGDLPVLSVDQYAYVINMTTARKLNMFPSVEILQIAETVD